MLERALNSGTTRYSSPSVGAGWARSTAPAMRSWSATWPSKFSRKRLRANRELLARLEREAKVLASLNHPNIAAIYGLETFGATRALVLELVEGPTLADRIVEGPIPIEEALRIAFQIAEALQAAHARGVVHRDLKPANIKLTLDGRVKVLDFGLAKVFGVGTPVTNASDLPTLPKGTAHGVILGTAAYMSPEQARGKPVDKRADLWAFGVVLYEMLTGVKLFTDETVSDVLAAVLTRQPELEKLRPATPASVRRVLRRCLNKDPNERLHDIADARLELVDTEMEERSSVPEISSRTRLLGWVAAGILGLVLALVVGFRPNGGAYARWRPDGRELFYLGPEGDVTAVSVVARGVGAIGFGTPETLFAVNIAGGGNAGGQSHQYDVSSDGERFLVNTRRRKRRRSDHATPELAAVKY